LSDPTSELGVVLETAYHSRKCANHRRRSDDRIGQRIQIALEETMPAWTIHVVGNIGVLLILVAYYLLSTGRLRATSAQYQVMNLVGALIIMLYSILLSAWASVVLNGAWAIIAVVALLAIQRARAES
jgi:hypothetical protein